MLDIDGSSCCFVPLETWISILSDNGRENWKGFSRDRRRFGVVQRGKKLGKMVLEKDHSLKYLGDKLGNTPPFR